MFFVFYISVLTIYVPSSNNYVLKKKHIQDDVTDAEDENLVNEQDVRNNSWLFSTHKPLFQIIQDLTNTKSPNLKSNVFDKRLSDEMLSIKQFEQVKDIAYTSPNLMTRKSSMATSTLELKKKWPIVDLLFQSDIPGSLQYIDEFEKLYLINSSSVSNEVTTTINENSIVDKNNVYSDTEQEQKDAKDKVVGLRSLLNASPMPGRMYHSIAIKQCTCAKTSPTTTYSALRKGSNTPQKLISGNAKDCTRKPTSYPILPYYNIPYAPYDVLSVPPNFPNFYYPSNVINAVNIPPQKHHKPSRPSIEDDLYYEDSFERDKYPDAGYDDDYLENDKEKMKKPKHEKDRVLIIDYDDEPKDKKITWDTKIHQENPNILANDILNDLKIHYSDTVIKKCYCSSSTRYITTTTTFRLSSLLCSIYVKAIFVLN